MAKRKQLTTADMDLFLSAAEAGVHPLVDAVTSLSADLGSIPSADIKATQRRLVLLSRDATSAACALYTMISIAENRERMAALSAASATP